MALLNKMMFTHSGNGHLIVAASLDTALTLGMCDNDQQLYLWVVDSATSLGRVNIKTGHIDIIGKLGIAMEEISFDSHGHLLGVTGKDLYRINHHNGALTLLSCQDDIGSQRSSQRAMTTHSGAATSVGGSRSLVGAFRADPESPPAQLAFDLARLFIKLYSVDEENLVQLAILDGRTMEVGVFGYGTIYGRAKSTISRFQIENPGVYTTNSRTGRTTTLAEHQRKQSGLLAESLA